MTDPNLDDVKPIRPGTLTVTVGSRSVVLNPEHDWKTFNNARAEIEEMLIGITGKEQSSEHIGQAMTQSPSPTSKGK